MVYSLNRFGVSGGVRGDSGNYHWRIGRDAIVCDWQTVGKNHLHMTLRGRLKS